MNLCLVCRDIGPESHGGLARAMCDLAETLADAGHSVHFLTDGSGSTPQLTGVSVVRVRLPGVRPLRDAGPESAAHNLLHATAVYREVLRLHEQQQVDAALAPLWRSEGAVCLLDERFPTIVSCMTSLRTLTEVDRSYLRLPDIGERLALEREALARSRYLHGLTDAVLNKTISDYGLSPAAAAVIGRGLRDRGTRSVGERASGPASVLFVGRIERRKGVDTLLSAARALIDDGLDVRFTLVGPEADPTFRTAFELDASVPAQLRHAVRFVGAVPDAELYRLYAESDIVCVPSRYESHGIVLMEAMMFGKPIVTCDAGGITEVVDAGRNALVSPPEDIHALVESLRLLIRDRRVRSRVGAAARETYEQRFDIARATSRMEAFIEEVAAIHPVKTVEVTRELAGLIHKVLAIAPHECDEIVAALLGSDQSARPGRGDRVKALARHRRRLRLAYTRAR